MSIKQKISKVKEYLRKAYLGAKIAIKDAAMDLTEVHSNIGQRMPQSYFERAPPIIQTTSQFGTVSTVLSDFFVKPQTYTTIDDRLGDSIIPQYGITSIDMGTFLVGVLPTTNQYIRSELNRFHNSRR